LLLCRNAAANSLDGASIRSLNRKKPARDIGRRPKSRSSPMWVLLLLPFIGLLWVPFYNFQEPALFGFPFFYWYQLAWVPITSLLIWLVYRKRAPDQAP
jgi:FtsH-binding integral membrane protein